MNLNSIDKINYANIGLMIISTALAFLLPFEVFLIAYSVLGPLHYLTEISWLHDKQYYTKGKYDFVFLIIVGLLLLISQYATKLDLDLPTTFSNRTIFIAFLSAFVLITVKNNYLKVLGIFLLIACSKLADHYEIFFSVFLPTLIHVFVFTAIFVLYGSLKTNSRSGYLSLVVMVACALFLFYATKTQLIFPISNYVKDAYRSFEALNYFTLVSFFNVKITPPEFEKYIYQSTQGLALMRFIAFAYTYHYLNWFSKTEVIKWHKMPKARLIILIILWLISVSLYAYNYKVGFEWLFFLSFLHVFLEFPLNFVSIKGTFEEILKLLSFSHKTIQK